MTDVDVMNASASEFALCNKVAMSCHLLEAVLITIAYLAEAIKGTEGIAYVLVVILLAMVPPVLEIIFYNKQKNSSMIKHIVAFGFAAMYTFIMLTTDNPFTFLYVIPMLIAITVYNDFKYSLPIEIGVVLVNAIQLTRFYFKGIYTAKDSVYIEIQALVMIALCFYQLYASRVTEKINQMKLMQMQSQNERAENLLNNTMQISGQMMESISSVFERASNLGESMSAMQEAMAEVNSGTNDTAEAVQKQLNQTESIQQMVNSVEEGANSIINSMNENRAAIAAGNENVRVLVEQVGASVESGKTVTEELSSLDEYMNQMNSIVDIINGITSQTSLLALNASIEAARAGEAGKGFAVVASEISQMAQQTQDSTVKIAGLIKNVSEAIGSVIHVSTEMIEMIENQSNVTEKTAESFSVIEKNSESVFSYSNELADYVKQLAEANREIIDSISTISAISEEVAAHASDTQHVSADNNAIVEEIIDMSGRLEQLAQQLNSEEKN